VKFVVATNNGGKLQEFRDILKEFGHEAVSLKEVNIDTDVEETGETFRENAYMKAGTIAKLSGLPTIADDSGLMVEALGGEPGVYSARYCGRHGDDAANNEKLLEKMKGNKERRAKFVSAVCAVFPDGRVLQAEGECPGEILHEPKGNGGFGYDPLFYVPALGKTFAQMDKTEKNMVSHRKKALDKLKILLSK
jgi:non-canonical purine NTP pyrophosphatase, rdgB/HAM1 family